MTDLSMMPYRHGLEQLDDHLELARLRVLRYMRRFPERLVSGGELYTDRTIGRGELISFIHPGVSDSGRDWLESLGMPELDDLEDGISRLSDHIDGRLCRNVDGDVVLPIEDLRATFGLDETALKLLILAAAPRLSANLSKLYSVAWADFSLREPSAVFLLDLLCEPGQKPESLLSHVLDTSPLVRSGLVEPLPHARWTRDTPRLFAPLSVSSRVLNFLRSEPSLEGGFPLACHQVPPVLTEETSPLVEQLGQTLAESASRQVILRAEPGSGRANAVAAWAAQTHQNMLRVDLDQLKPLLSELSDVVAWTRSLVREALLTRSLIYLDLGDPCLLFIEELVNVLAPALKTALSSFSGAVVLATSPTLMEAEKFLDNAPTIELPPPSKALQLETWKEALGLWLGEEESLRIAEDLVRVYRLTPGAIRKTVKQALAHAPERKRSKHQLRRILSKNALLARIQRDFSGGIEAFTQVWSVDLSLDDVVLSDDIRARISDVLRFATHADKVLDEWGFGERNPGARGLSVLLSGPSGTGKTLTAGAMANTLGRVLLKVDLSRVVDKYIGQTEKNLARVFDSAERTQAVLLFDEADSLFSKRTKVQSSNDRYANLEVNYLLQRLEAYDGVSFLTTNFENNIDDAFMRRIRFRISFPMPDEALRAQLWQRLLPPRAPRDHDIDWRGLGRDYPLSGGYIRNAILRAAIHAADQDVSLSMKLLRDAAEIECREIGLLLNLVRSDHDFAEPDFGN